MKTNVGHLEPAAGIVGIIKVLLSMQHQQLPGTVHFATLNPHIQLENSPFYIVKETQPWLSELPRRAGISSFGFGGAIAHVVVEEGPKQTLQTQQSKPYYLVTLSAKNSDVLIQRMRDLQTWITSHTQISLEAIAYTLNAGRSHFNHRCALVIDSLADLQDKLQQLQEHPHKKIQGLFPRRCNSGTRR